MEAARTGRDLILATKPFAQDHRARSWAYTLTGMGLMIATMALAAWARPWPVALAASVLASLLILRVFILFHDFMHGSILRKSWAAKALFYVYGLWVLAPPKVWKRSHDYHHAHTAKMIGSQIGSFPTVSDKMWERMSRGKRAVYRIMRHPATIAFGYLTVFLWGMVVAPLLRNARESWDAAVALVVHVGVAVAVGAFFGGHALLFGVLLPHALACAIGAYLFYAQHNFPDMKLRGRHEWSYASAALEASSFMRCGPLMQWFSGNIGYHHVHHLNPSIPFYRLPSAMEAIPELQSPGETSLSLRDIASCLRLKVWSNDDARMTTFPSAPASPTGQPKAG